MTAVIDEVGPWTEVKIEIVQKYARVFRTIIGATDYFHPVYMDAFAGSGMVVSEMRRCAVESTPARIIKIEPPFEEYHLVEADPGKKAILDSVVGDQPHVTVYLGDGNEICLKRSSPR